MIRCFDRQYFMISSKFRVWPVLSVVICSIGLAVLAVPFISGLKTSSDIGDRVFKTFFIVWFVFMVSFLVLGEIRKKVIKIIISDDCIIKKSYLGFGSGTRYGFQYFTGYKTSIISSKAGSYEYLYLMHDEKKVVKISEYYHQNYSELKSALAGRNIKNLGKENWSLLIEIKEIFR